MKVECQYCGLEVEISPKKWATYFNVNGRTQRRAPRCSNCRKALFN